MAGGKLGDWTGSGKEREGAESAAFQAGRPVLGVAEADCRESQTGGEEGVWAWWEEQEEEGTFTYSDCLIRPLSRV